MRSILIATLAAAALATAAPATVIYNARLASPGSVFVISDNDENSSFMELPGTGREFDSRVGDRITFAGTDRLVTSFSVRVQAFAGSATGITSDVELSLYEANGGLPGALIWSGVAPQVLLPNSTAPREIVFAPNVLLPDSICFAVAFLSVTRAAGESRVFGAVSAADPTIGSSPVTTLSQLSADSTWRLEDNSTFGGGIFRNVDARVEAIPSPSIGLPALVGASLFRPRRRRR